MDPVILLIVLIGGLVVLGFFINRKLTDLKGSSEPSQELLEYLKTTNTNINAQNERIDKTLRESRSELNKRLDAATRVIGNVQKNIGEMSEIGRGMKELQQFLQSPKLRGNIGEQVLRDLITQMFPKSSFSLQHTFKSGEKVDAAIKTAAGIIPIDSKFPMENYQKMSKAKDSKERSFHKRVFLRDIKKHIEDISKKYILPEEGTMDFALMYIPSESVYYEIVNEPSLLKPAQHARVYPVSPTTLYAHLRTILLSFEGQEINKKARRVFDMLRAIQKDYEKVDTNLSKLQKHVTNAGNMMNNVVSSFTQLGQKIVSTEQLGEGIDEEAKKLKK